MNAIRFAFFLVLSVVFVPKSFATHIVGGEITYRCLGNDSFEITMTIYRDCFNGRVPFDSIARIAVYKTGTDSLFTELGILYNEQTNDTLPIILDDPCLSIPPGVCVHKATYQAIVSLPYRPEGYTVVYQRCCRNWSIRNTTDPRNSGITFLAEISGKSLLTCNSSATFKQWPPVAICVHQPLHFDHSATDLDGDSLRYRLCAPLNGPDSLHATPNPPPPPPYEELVWIDPPYSLLNVLGGDPLAIDPLTGLITGTPNTLGNFVVGVCVDEFRNDTLISTTKRDFQYNVADCGRPAAAFFIPKTICDTLQVQFENHSQNASNFEWYFDWPDNLAETSTAYAPIYNYPDTGSYNVALIVSPNTMCSDTFVFQIHLVKTASGLVVTADPSEIQRGETSQLTAILPGAIDFSWKPETRLSNAAVFNPVASPLESGTYTVVATLANGCEKTGSVAISVVPPPCGEPFVFFPTGFSPNGDGQNDVLKMESNIVTDVYWTVFDRWGVKLFEANSLDDSWDGTYQGQPQPAETYGYYYRVRCSDGKESFRKGNVTLLR